MSLALRWAAEKDLDLVALTRLRCYSKQAKDLEDYRQMIRSDGRVTASDILLAERDNEAIGTATSLSMTMWVRGSPLPCQGVAWVGTVRSARRSFSKSESEGVATQIMFETLRRGREREEVVSALMPFRASFYEHFGYGLVERRAEWTIPLSILPASSDSNIRYYEPADADAVTACRQRQVEAGQCDIETSAAAWINRRSYTDEGFEFVDRARDGICHSWMHTMDDPASPTRTLRVIDAAWDSIDALRRQLAFLGGQRDQYAAAIMQLPVDVPVNHFLRESQIPHRPVQHPAASVRLQTRMQVRILDHARFLQSLKLPREPRGQATVAVRETDGGVSKFKLQIDSGHLSVSQSDASADIECTDVNWATIACGAMNASTAARCGLIDVTNNNALTVLDALSIGPAPFSGEYF